MKIILMEKTAKKKTHMEAKQYATKENLTEL